MECILKVLTHLIFTLACGKPLLPGTQKIWIYTASTIYILALLKHGRCEVVFACVRGKLAFA